MESFKSESIVDFFDRHKTNLDCLEYLSHTKWREGCGCVKCRHKRYGD